MVSWNHACNLWSLACYNLKVNKTFFWLTIILTLLGLFAVADASAPQALLVFNDSYFFVKQQIKWALLGLFAMFFAIFMPKKFWQQVTYPFLFVSIFFLVLVLIPGFSSRILGARRWLNLGPISFQPSEVAKLSLSLGLAYFAEKKAQWWKYLSLIGLIMFLIMLQPDLGTSLVIAAISAVSLFVAGMPLVYFLTTSVLGVFGVVLLIIFSEYRRQRLLTFLSSSTDPLGASYHIQQILIALGTGGLFGVGIGQSRQKHLFLPETATDSVFAVIAEEIGFIGAFIVILLLTFFVINGFKIASNAKNTFDRILAVNLTTWIAAQMFLNISSVVALTPLTGIPLPFFSYGGSSLTMLLLSAGILLNIDKNNKK